MTLRVSNPTMQSWTVPYRVGEPGSAEFATLRQFSLGRGQQVELILDDAAMAQVVGHLEAHGARSTTDLNHDMQGFNGLLYSVIRVVAVEEIEQANAIDTQTREDRAVSQAVRGALGFDNAARQPTDARPPALATEVEVLEHTPRGERPRRNAVKFKMEVTPDGAADDPIIRRAVT